MIWRFTLSHEVLGELEISEPDGWQESKLVLDRHADFASLAETFTGEFIFYGDDGENNGGIDFIRQVEREYGVDAYLGITIQLAPDNYAFETVFQGQLDLSEIHEMYDNKAQVVIIRDDFWAKFINRFDTQVNIQSEEDLDGDAAEVFEHINLRLTSQYIDKKFAGLFGQDVPFLSGIGANNYVQLTFGGSNQYIADLYDFEEINEINNQYVFEVAENSQRPVSNFILEEGGDFNVTNFTLIMTRFDRYLGFMDSDIKVAFQFNGGAFIYATRTDYSKPGESGTAYFSRFEYSGLTALTAASSVKFFVYNDSGSTSGDFRILFDDQSLFATPPDYFSALEITQSTYTVDTSAQGFFVHDVGGAISDRLTGLQESFYSEYLGSGQTKYRQYDEDGCGSNYGLLQGLQLRGYNLTEKQYSLSMKKWWEGINPIQNLSLMYDEVDGRPVIRVEEKEHCFEDGDTSINIPFVREITRRYDPDSLYKTVKTGYKKWESDDSASGLDIPQTKHTYATQLKRTGKDLVLESEFIAGDLTIETTRRKSRIKTADYKYDNESFIIKLQPNPSTVSPDLSPDVDDYLPELSDVTGVTGLLNESTRYNKTLTPARQLLRWLKFLSTSVYQYPGSLFTYTYGEGNYEMSATSVDACEPDPATLTENQDIVADPNPVYLPFDYEFTNVPLDYSDYVTIRNNRKKAIGISQTDEGFTKFYIKKMVYDQTKGLATINAWPKTFMDILVIEGDYSKEPCTDSGDVVIISFDTDLGQAIFTGYAPEISFELQDFNAGLGQGTFTGFSPTYTVDNPS